MIFYKKNNADDKLFLELQTKLNLSYWIAADAEHYYQTCKDNINTYDYKRLVKQFDNASSIANEFDTNNLEMSDDHIKAIKILRDFVTYSIKELDFRKKDDNENDDCDVINLAYQQEKFINKFLRFLHKREPECYLQTAYLYFSKGMLSLEDQYWDSKRSSHYVRNRRNHLVNYLNTAIDKIDSGIKDPNVLDFIMDECAIIGIEKFSDKDIDKYINLHIDFMNMWKECITTTKNSYDEILSGNLDEYVEAEEISMLEYTQNNYFGIINELGIKINQMIIDKMNIEFPKTEIFSRRVIKNPMERINEKWQLRL